MAVGMLQQHFTPTRFDQVQFQVQYFRLDQDLEIYRTRQAELLVERVVEQKGN